MQKNAKFLVVSSTLLCIVVCARLFAPWYTSDINSAWSPVWSSDGYYIAFECTILKFSDLFKPDFDEYSTFSLRDICIFDKNNNETIRLTEDRSPSSLPSWSPSGLRLAWLKGNDTVVIWDIPTGKPIYFQSPKLFQRSDGHLDWSQDGNRIFIQGDGTIFDVENEIFIPPVKPQNDLSVCCFTWSPDGNYLAFKKLKFEGLNVYNYWQVVIMKNDEIILTNEIEANIDNPYLQWSPDGSVLAWRADVGNRHLLALSYVLTQKTVFLRVDDGFIGFGGIEWSPRGDKIALRLGDKLAILTPQSEAKPSSLIIVKPPYVNLQGSSFSGFSWSPDEKLIVYESDWREGSQIWLLQLDESINFPLYDK